MGVKTKEVGPRGWIVLESLSRYFDDNISTVKNKLDFISFTKELVLMYGFIFPCVYCRVSFRGFTNPKDPYSKNTDISRMIVLKDGMKKFTYHMHNCVSNKLKNQEITDNPKDKSKIIDKWNKKHITYEEALEMKFFDIHEEIFWENFIMFLGFVFCDYRPDECKYIWRFLILISKLLYLTNDSFYPVFKKALERTKDHWDKSMSPETRFNIVWTLYKTIYTFQNWDIKYSPLDLEYIFKNATVGECVK